MTAKAKSASRAFVPFFGGVAQAGVAPITSLTLEDRLQSITLMGQRINGYIQFMSQVGSLSGASAEAKARAVAAFHERLVEVEGQLGRIQEALRLE